MSRIRINQYDKCRIIFNIMGNYDGFIESYLKASPSARKNIIIGGNFLGKGDYKTQRKILKFIGDHDYPVILGICEIAMLHDCLGRKSPIPISQEAYLFAKKYYELFPKAIKDYSYVFDGRSLAYSFEITGKETFLVSSLPLSRHLMLPEFQKSDQIVSTYAGFYDKTDLPEGFFCIFPNPSARKVSSEENFLEIPTDLDSDTVYAVDLPSMEVTTYNGKGRITGSTKEDFARKKGLL